MQFGSIEAVVAAVQEDANAEVEKIERDLAAATARAREEDRRLPVVVPDAEARISRARRQVHDRIAAEEAADHQSALKDREMWIAQAMAEGQRRVLALDVAAARADLVRLAREAIDRMPDQTLELLVSTARADLLDAATRDEIMAVPGKTIARVTPSPSVGSGGCIVQTIDGRIRYDNTYAARCRRFESIWRARLGEMWSV
jgi:vacuolar-type H+-ATPase subunit E/Vma4